MKRICMTCNKEFEGKEWMKQCWDCYKNFKGMKRISAISRSKGVFIMTHPDVTREEVDDWIRKVYGSVHDPSNWGAVEITNDKVRLWWNCQNDD